MNETTLHCKLCNCEDIDEEEVDEGVHVGCGGEIEEVCAYCLGTGEVVTDGMDSSGNIERGVNSQRCICQIRDDDE